LALSGEGRLEWIRDDKLLDLNLWESDHIFFPWIAEEKLFYRWLIKIPFVKRKRWEGMESIPSYNFSST
jgi:hypothetical protein